MSARAYEHTHTRARARRSKVRPTPHPSPQPTIHTNLVMSLRAHTHALISDYLFSMRGRCHTNHKNPQTDLTPTHTPTPTLTPPSMWEKCVPRCCHWLDLYSHSRNARAGACTANCYGYTCDYWEQGNIPGICDNGGQDLEVAYGCDCSGCACAAVATPSPSMGNPYACYTLNMADSYGDGWNGNAWSW